MNDAFRHFEELYQVDADPWRFGERGAELLRHQCIAEVASRVPHGRILEVGCSAGALTARLSRLQGRLVAFDLSAVAARRAREVVAGVEGRAQTPMFLVGSATALPVRPVSFDLVIASDGPISWQLDRDDRKTVYRQLHAALSPGGHALITDYLPRARFPELIAEVEASPLRIAEIRYLHDRPWYAMEGYLKGMLRHAVVRRVLASIALARALDRVGAIFGARAASHILILTKLPESAARSPG